MKLQNRKWLLMAIGVMFITLLTGIYWLTLHHTPATPSGVQGTVSYGPLCPTEPCSVQPTFDFDIIAVQLNGNEAGRTRPDKNGQYTLMIPAGTYDIKASRSFASELGSPPHQAIVKSGTFTHLDLSFDTGIR